MWLDMVLPTVSSDMDLPTVLLDTLLPWIRSKCSSFISFLTLRGSFSSFHSIPPSSSPASWFSCFAFHHSPGKGVSNVLENLILVEGKGYIESEDILKPKNLRIF